MSRRSVPAVRHGASGGDRPRLGAKRGGGGQSSGVRSHHMAAIRKLSKAGIPPRQIAKKLNLKPADVEAVLRG